MAVTCTPASLVDAAKCFRGLSPLYLKAIQIRLLCAQLNGESMTCDPNTLLSNSACIAAMSFQDMEAVITYLLCQIANSGGGGGGAQLVTYTVDPPADPSNTGAAAIAYDPTGTLPTKGWNTSSLTWN